ncbi:MAG: hypothetical protein ACKOFX_08330, partial [Solirubrobacterales bacterium]
HGHAFGGHAAGQDTTGDCCDSCDKPPSHDTSRIAWAKLMARVGEEFPLECPGCGGDIRLISFITEPGPIRKILTHLGEPLEPPPLAGSRQSPEAAGLGETPRRHEKNATSGEQGADPGNRFPGRGSLGRREQPAHEPLIRRATLADVPLAGLSLR